MAFFWTDEQWACLLASLDYHIHHDLSISPLEYLTSRLRNRWPEVDWNSTRVSRKINDTKRKRSFVNGRPKFDMDLKIEMLDPRRFPRRVYNLIQTARNDMEPQGPRPLRARPSVSSVTAGPAQPAGTDDNNAIAQKSSFTANRSSIPKNVDMNENKGASEAPSLVVNRPTIPTNTMLPGSAQDLTLNVVEEPEQPVRRGTKRVLEEVEEFKTSNKRFHKDLADKMNTIITAVDQLKGCIKHAKNVFEQAPGTDSVFNILQSAMRIANVATQPLRGQRDDEHWITAPRPRGETIEWALCKKFENLYNVAKDVFDGDLPKLLPNWSERVNQLLNSWGIDHPLHEKFLNIEMVSPTKPGLAYVLQFLLAEAACQWVFYSSFPDFEEQDSGILYEYREMIASQKGMFNIAQELYYSTHSFVDGLKTLQNMDYNAYRKCLKSESYGKSILPIKAERLTSRFLQEVAPLFVRSPAQEGRRNESWGQDDEDERFRRVLLAQFWQKCLKVKATMVLNIEKFSLLWPNSTVFDSETMSAGNHRAGETAPAVKHVRFCVWPGLVSHWPIPLGDGITHPNWRLALVDRRNFLKSSQVGDRGGKELLVPAFVV
jgi:hypothetical protein